ncbi:MAG: NAD(+) synthase [Clostridia bacterium]|nr:NAD(+) synthase [Clostridia bacterium]
MYEKFGFVKVAASSPRMKVADVDKNVDTIISVMKAAQKEEVSFICFPELCVTGYTCGDLFLQNTLQKKALEGLKKIIESKVDITAIVGLPLNASGRLFNCAAVVNKGRLLAVIPKKHIPNYNEYYEKRWFDTGISFPDKINLFGEEVPSGLSIVLHAETPEGDIPFAVEICEDLWAPSPPSGELSAQGALMIFNPSASTALAAKQQYRKSLISQQSGRCISGYIYSSAGFDESTTDVVFCGYSCVYEYGTMLNENSRFDRSNDFIAAEIDLERLKFLRRRNTTFFACSEPAKKTVTYKANIECAELKHRKIEAYPFVPSGDDRNVRLKEISDIQSAGLIKRLEHIGCNKVVLGISGGLDSTLALLVAAKAYKRMNVAAENIIAVTMPGFGTGERTYSNALALIEALGATLRIINIDKAVTQHFADIGHDSKTHNIAYENSQARERTQILMDIANMEGAIVMGTGDLSELALGWSTYNGDHMSMYNVNCSIPKTLVKHLVDYLGNTEIGGSISPVINDILATPISPELIPAKDGQLLQKTEEILGKYDLHDFFLYNFMQHGSGCKKLYHTARIAFRGIATEAEIKSALEIFIKRFFAQQFKRSCMPDGPKVGTVSLSPRGDWRMPSDASAAIWIEELKEI